MKKLAIILTLILFIGVTKTYSQGYLVYEYYWEKGGEAYKTGDYSSAIHWMNAASEYAKKYFGVNHPEYTSALSNIAICYSRLGNYGYAIDIQTKVLSIEKESLGIYHPNYITSLRNLASYYGDIGNYVDAMKLYEKALDATKVTLGSRSLEYATSLHDLAVLHNRVGNFSKAIDLHEMALSIRKGILGEQHIDYSTSLGNLALCYSNIGDYNKSIEYNERALAICSEIVGNTHHEYAKVLNNLATNYADIDYVSKAIELHKQVLALLQENVGTTHPDYATALHNLAYCYSKIGEHTKAIELYKQAIAIREKSTIGYALSISNLALAYYHLGHNVEAVRLSEQAFLSIKDIIQGEFYPEYDAFIGNLCGMYYSSRQYNNIVNYWPKLFSSIKKKTLSQFRETTSTQRQMYWNTNIISNIVVPNNIYTKVLSDDTRSMELSYNSLLFSKGVILASDIEFDKVIRESGDTALLEKFEELRTTRAILNTYYNKPIAERPEGEVERLESRAEVLEKDLLEGSKEYADFTRRLKIEWMDVQAALGDKDVAIEILAADEHIDEDTPPYYAALVLRKGWDAPKFVELCGAEELQAYFDSENGLAMMYREANSKKLYDLIWGKLSEHINEGDNVYFSPGGLLHQVNVELLQDADGRLANEKYNLHRVSSTRELCFEKPKIAHSEAVLYGGLRYDLDSTTMIAQSRAVRPEEELYAMRGMLSDSLRGELKYLSASKIEVEEISKQMNQHGIKTTLYIEQVGNEESFKALSGKETPIIHLATHGFFFKNEEAKVKPFFRMMSMDQERPRPDNSLRRSGLAFAGAQKAWDGEEIPRGIDDGVMLAQEIASMDLAGTDLVVLSACETGLGEINSEGVFGLQRAFKKAGVQTLIMSLWKVHDEATALFMQTFYDNLLSGKSKRDSFATAQMALREHRDYGKDPYYWAGFIMLD